MTEISEWPAHETKEIPYRALSRASKREDRMVTSVLASYPPLIAHFDFQIPSRYMVKSEDSIAALKDLDRETSLHSPALAEFLLRVEAISSSRIEEIEASAEDYARAYAGNKGNPSAELMVSGTKAVAQLINQVGDEGQITHQQLWDAHALLMEADPSERHLSGRYREQQNWIGGNNGSPKGAIHVPPPHEDVIHYMDDLLIYANRNDVPALWQAAVVHAQFESIHPFTDGNGRIGRALIAAILRRRRMSERVVAPIASALIVTRDYYFKGVNEYRVGKVLDFFDYFLTAVLVACEEAAKTAREFAGLADQWHDRHHMSKGTSMDVIMDLLLTKPVQTDSDLEKTLDLKSETRRLAVRTLEAAGLIREVTGRTKNKAWIAIDVVDNIEQMNLRINHRMTDLIYGILDSSMVKLK